MTRTRSKDKSRSDSPGGFGGLPKIVWMHLDYRNLSGNAVKLLMDFACQYNGHNNGDLTNAFSILKQRGWRSKTTVQKATQELLDAGMIVQTREGMFINPGGRCALYGLTWKAIDDCTGKNITMKPTTTPPRKFSLENCNMPSPQNGQGSVHKLYPQRVRGEDGKFVSVQKLDRLRLVP